MYKILFHTSTFLISFLIAIALTIFGIMIRYFIDGDNVSEPTQTVLISLWTTLCTYIIGLFVQTLYKYKKYIGLAGYYDGYAYKNEENERDKDFYAIKEKPQSVAILDYLGGNDFRIQVGVKYPPEIDDLVWEGDFKLITTNTATIGWWYKGDNLKYEVGLKQAVIVNNKIVLFSDGKSIHRREVFIKKTKPRSSQK